MIIECKNIIGVQFDLRKRYPNTVHMLDNFVRTKLRRLVDDANGQVCSIYNYKSLDSHNPILNGFVFASKDAKQESKESISRLRKTRGFRMSADYSTNQVAKPKQETLGTSFKEIFTPPTLVTKPFKHSGFASKQKGPLLVESNNIGMFRVHASKSYMREASFSSQIQDIKNRFQQDFGVLKKNSSYTRLTDELEDTRKPPPNLKSSITTGHASLSNFEETQGTESPAHNLTQGGFHKSKIGQRSKSMVKADIRKTLYPAINNEFMGSRTAWVSKQPHSL